MQVDVTQEGEMLICIAHRQVSLAEYLIVAAIWEVDKDLSCALEQLSAAIKGRSAVVLHDCGATTVQSTMRMLLEQMLDRVSFVSRHEIALAHLGVTP
ncbi:MAG: hypothetical protein RLZZ360_464 [Candidatus Parcubacteria bacterium]|jgi:hypothetical protein